jgi:predicted dehydrogenase
MEQARNPLRIGILGAARIAPSAIIYPAQASGHQLLAVASRDKGRAEAFAKQYQVAKTYTSYQDLIDDPQIDVVYNALHNGGHGPWNIRALNAGKHVLSEKPSASNAAEAKEVLAVVNKSGKVFMEGFHYYYHPVFQRALSIIKSGEIGEVIKVETSLLIPMPDPADLRLQFDLAGGATMDVGCYAIHSQRMISQLVANGEPSIIKTEANAADGKVDTKLYMQLQYPNGVSALAKGDFESQSMQAPLTVTGSKGTLHLPNFVVSGWDPRVIVESGGKKRVEHMPSISTYTYQLVALADAIDLGKAVKTDAKDALAQAIMIDAAYTSSNLPLRPSFVID